MQIVLPDGRVIDERRQVSSQCFCKFEDKILQTSEDSAVSRNEITNLSKRINGAMDGIKEHIEHGGKWRTTIFSTLVILLLAIFSGIYAFGLNAERIAQTNQILMKHIEKQLVDDVNKGR